ncbi:Zn-ribbon domain-containing OB-fold protein [Chloroflexota bacterium]
MSEYKKSLPIPDDWSVPLFDGAKRHKLMSLRCKDCGTYLGIPVQFASRLVCDDCWSSELEWVEASGRGEVYSFVVVHQIVDPAFAHDIPYNVAIIQLEEGGWMVSSLVGCSNADIEVGMPVEAVFEDITDNVALPKFKPAG